MSGPGTWDIARAKLLNNKLQIDQIALHAIEARHLAGTPLPKWTFSINFDRVGWDRTQTHVLAVFPLNVLIQHDAEERRLDLATLSVMIRIAYRLHPSFDQSDEQHVCHYLALAGWLQAWPYLRAEVQDLSTRLGFPPALLPVLLSGQTSEVACERVAPRDELAPANDRVKRGRRSPTQTGTEKPTSGGT